LRKRSRCRAQRGQLLIQTCNVVLVQKYCQRHTYGSPGSYVRLSVSDTDGEDAVQKFEVNCNDISRVLLDVSMPRLSGPDAYARICQGKPGIAVIFTSGYGDEASGLARMVEQGVLLLHKPCGPKILARKIRELLDRTGDR